MLHAAHRSCPDRISSTDSLFGDALTHLAYLCAARLIYFYAPVAFHLSLSWISTTIVPRAFLIAANRAMDDRITPRIYTKESDDAVQPQAEDAVEEHVGDSKGDDVGRHHFVIPEGEQRSDVSDPSHFTTR